MKLSDHIKRLWRRRELLWMWTLREIKVRYKQSLLGVAWAVLQPLSLMLMYTIVFSLLVRVPTGDTPYPLFSYTALVPWTFLSSSIALGVPSLVRNVNMVTKVNMPGEALPIASVLAGLVDFAVAAVLLGGMLLYYQVDLHWAALWAIPLLLVQVMLTLAVVLFGSALNVLFRDIRFVVPLATQLWMYATPIVYPLELVPERYHLVYHLNPMVSVIDGYRKSILAGESPDPGGTLVGFAVSAGLLVASYAVFKRLERVFADII